MGIELEMCLVNLGFKNLRLPINAAVITAAFKHNTMTQKEQIQIFQQIIVMASNNPSSQEFGDAVMSLLKQHNALEWWEDQVNPKSFTEEEMEVIHAVQSGWQFYNVDGVTWYYMNDIEDGSGPWANYGYGTPNLRIVSSEMINRLRTCGKFPRTKQMGDDPYKIQFLNTI